MLFIKQMCKLKSNACNTLQHVQKTACVYKAMPRSNFLHAKTWLTVNEYSVIIIDFINQQLQPYRSHSFSMHFNLQWHKQCDVGVCMKINNKRFRMQVCKYTVHTWKVHYSGPVLQAMHCICDHMFIGQMCHASITSGHAVVRAAGVKRGMTSIECENSRPERVRNGCWVKRSSETREQDH